MTCLLSKSPSVFTLKPLLCTRVAQWGPLTSRYLVKQPRKWQYLNYFGAWMGKQHRKSGYLVIGNLRLRCWWLVLNITLTTLLPFPAYPPKEITSNKHVPLSSQKRHSFKKGGPRGIDCNGEISLCGACAGAPGKLMVKFNSTSLQIQASCWLKSPQVRSKNKDVHNWYTIIKHTLYICIVCIVYIHARYQLYKYTSL